MSSRTSADREQTAVCGNFFEQRYLDRRLALLTSEREYASRLIDFSAREMRLHYRRLMQRVAKVKSNLTPMEILRFRHMESRGALQQAPEAASRPQSANVVRIAAATKRLQLGIDPAPVRAHSAAPRPPARPAVNRPASAYVLTAPEEPPELSSPASSFSSHQALLDATRTRMGPPVKRMSCTAELGVDTNPFQTDATNLRRARLLTRERRCMSAFAASKERFLSRCEPLALPREMLEDPFAHYSKMAAGEKENEGEEDEGTETKRQSNSKKAERLRREVLETLKSNGYLRDV